MSSARSFIAIFFSPFGNLFCPAQLGKELLQKQSTFVLHKSALDLGRVIIRKRKQVVYRPARARFRVVCPEHHSLYARIYYRPGAHRARFERHEQFALPEPPAAERLARSVYRFNFGVCEGVLSFSRLLRPTETISPFLVTTAPTGTSPSAAASRASAIAACISSLSVILPLPGYEGHVIKVYVV